MRKKEVTILNPYMVNPFFAYCLFWIVAIIAYIFSPSKLNGELQPALCVFLLCTIVLMAVFALFFNKKFKNKTFTIKYRGTSNIIILILIAAYIAEFVYSGGSPLLEGIFGDNGYGYATFGLPILHGFVITFSAFYGVYQFFMFCQFRSKKSLLVVALVLAYFLFILSRGLLLFMVAVCVLVFFIDKRIKLWHLVLLFVAAVIGCYLFGVLGNIRSGYAWNDSFQIIYVAQIDADRNGFFSPFYWVWEYLACSFRNLNYNATFVPEYSLSSLVSATVPSAVVEVLFPSIELVPIHLVEAQLNTGTTYARSFAAYGYIGMFIVFLEYAVLGLLAYKIHWKNFEYRIVFCGLLTFLFALSMFDNMLCTVGYSFALVYCVIWTLADTYLINGKKEKISVKYNSGQTR